jgi:hypothetical protein
MSATCTRPAWNLPGATTRPTLRPWNVTVASASTAAPRTSPVDESTPDGTSTAKTRAGCAFIRSISPAASARGSPAKPAPSSVSPAFASTTRTCLPRASRCLAMIRPSPPFAPPPHTTVHECAPCISCAAASAASAPARSISVATSCPASATRISSAV